MKGRDAYDALTARIIEQLKRGIAPWVRPWATLGVSDRPVNFATGALYRGSNVLALWIAQALSGYERGEWLTFRQAREMDACVRKGEHGTPIIFAQPCGAEREDDAEERPERRAGTVLRGYTVFNVAQIDGLPTPAETPAPAPFEALASAEDFIAGIGAQVRYGGDSAYYAPATDLIVLPARERFDSPGSFYSTALHEHAHWTGAPQRLARTVGRRFGDQAYAAEELVAELTAAFLTSDLGIPGTLQHPEYLWYWAQMLGEYEAALAAAASAATRAADYLHTTAADKAA